MLEGSPPKEFAPDIAPDDMFWRAIRRRLGGVDSNVERFVLAVASCWIQPGGFVVDLGANHGQHARVLGVRVGPGGSMLLVEADPTLAEDLEIGARESGLAVEVVNKAIGDDDAASFTFYRHPQRDQEGSLFRRDASIEYEELTVAVTSLDSLMLGRPSPQFIKIDVEGAEFSVLRGGKRFLAENSPLIACELSYDSEGKELGDLNYTMPDLLELLADVGWALYGLDGRRIDPVALASGEYDLLYECWIARDGSPAASFLTDVVPGLAVAFAWGATPTPPYPFHLDKHPILPGSASIGMAPE